MERGYKKVEGGKSIDYSFVADKGDGVPLKYCYKCNEDLPLYEFYSHAKRWDGMASECKDCDRKRKQSQKYKACRKKYRQENKAYISEYMKEYMKEYRKTPKRKAYMKEYLKKYYLRKKLERLNEQNNPH